MPLLHKGVVLLEWMARVNWVDVLIVIIVLRNTYIGSHRGFLGELFYILGVYLTIILAIHLYSIVSNFMNRYLLIPLNVSDLISFLLITFIIFFGFRFIYGFIQKIIKVDVFPVINKVGGSLLGFCRGYVVSTLVVLILLLIPIEYITISAKTRSVFAPFFIKTGVTLYRKSLSVISPAGGRDLNRLLAGAKPLELRLFRLRRRDRLDEMLE
jgi:uncharacterized membrane protein required for colicin V production